MTETGKTPSIIDTMDLRDRSGISCIYEYIKKVNFTVSNIGAVSGWLVYRKDFHEDGSVSDSYYIELSETDYQKLL
jgi:hypothetical protein